MKRNTSIWLSGIAIALAGSFDQALLANPGQRSVDRMEKAASPSDTVNTGKTVVWKHVTSMEGS